MVRLNIALIFCVCVFLFFVFPAIGRGDGSFRLGGGREVFVQSGAEVAAVIQNDDIAVIEGVLITAYCPCKKCCGKNADGITSRGRDAFRTRGVAVDPTVVPYGTTIVIPGAGEFTADDTGGAMRRDWRKRRIIHFDLRFSSHSQALQWGKQWLTVKIRR